MKWAPKAHSAIQKVPFFIRKKVKKRVETFVEEQGRDLVEMADVTALKKKFLSKGGMEKEIKGYDISACFGGQGCPNSVAESADLLSGIEKLMKAADIRSFLKSSVQGDLKFHHEFRVSISDCPNACSRPQIVDIGIIGAILPGITDEVCTLCGACVDACPDQAIRLNQEFPVIDKKACLACGKCVKVCPAGTLEVREKGYRVLLGGRLGRHPRLGMEVPGLYSQEGVLTLVEKCLSFYKTRSKKGRRFSQVLDSLDQIL